MDVIPGLATYFGFSFNLRKGTYQLLVKVSALSVVRLTAHPIMTTAVHHGHKGTKLPYFFAYKTVFFPSKTIPKI